MRRIFALTLFVLCGFIHASAQEKPALREIDRVRLAEAFRLSDKFGDTLWRGWAKAPFAVLLVTPDREFLIRHPQPTPDFTRLGYDEKPNSDVYYRDRKFSTKLLATFPAVGGISTIVIGQAENTDSKTSTPWVVTIMHEHFHQLQDSQPNFFKDVDALNLAHGDQSGYASPDISRQVSLLTRLLLEGIAAKSQAEFSTKLAAYVDARSGLKRMLNPDDYKYFSFQLWKEGLARYTEDRVANWAATKYRPSREFEALPDFTTFKATADQVRQGIINELTTLKLEDYKRVAFYPMGAAEGLLLDRANPPWRDRYFSEKFDNENYFKRRSALKN